MAKLWEVQCSDAQDGLADADGQCPDGMRRSAERNDTADWMTRACWKGEIMNAEARDKAADTRRGQVGMCSVE